MYMNRTKRWLAAVLSAVLLMSLLPTAALAGDGTLSDETSVESTAPITRAQLAEMIYDNENLKTQIDLAGGGGTDPDFQDISDCTSEQQAAIKALYKAQILSGASSTTFAPDGTVTRGEAVVAIWRAAGSRSNRTPMTASFNDLEPWYAAAVNCFYGAGMLSGTGGGAFSGDQDIPVKGVNSFLTAYDTNYDAFIENTVSGAVTRAEIAVQFYNEFYPELSKIEPIRNDMPFTDIDGCTSEQQTAIEFFYQRGIISGANSTMFAPYGPVSNLQLATLLKNCATANAGGTSGVEVFALTDAFQFLVDNGASRTEVEAANDNSNAPGLTADLVAWNNALKPETPTFSPAGGTIEDGQTVTITCADTGAVIYYTIDGSDPVTSSTRIQYTAPVSLTEVATTLKAVVVKNNLYSEIASAEYTVGGGSDPVGAVYPITIIGPTGEMNSYVDLDGNGEVCLIQDSPDTLFDPHDNDDPAIREQLESWVYNGWVFTAEKNGETKTYGPTEYVDDALKEFLNPLIADHWTLSMNSRDCGEWEYDCRITIIGPTGKLVDSPAIDLDENGEVYSIQGSTTTLYDPHDNADSAIQEQLTSWIYNGWVFTAEKDGETKTYGPTKDIDDGLKEFLNPKIKEGGWTLTMNSRDWGEWVGRYPIYIVGPTGTMDSYVELDGNGEVSLVQGSDTTLYDPHDNDDPTIRNQLKYWVYKGWVFTAEKDGETKTYGPTKYVDDSLKAFLNPLIADNWTLTMNSKSCGYYDYPDSGSSGSSGSSGNKTETTNPDGSTTTTVTGSNGTVTETTKNPDGSKEVVETKKDGTVTTTTTDSAGNETKVVEKADGSAETTVSNIDGSSSVTIVREDGTVEASVKLSAKVIEDAVDSDAAVTLPMPAVPVTADVSAAASVTVNLSAGRSARVEIPAENVTAGTVAILVKADGTVQVLKTSTVTENGVAVTVSDGDTVKIVDNSKDFTDVSSTYWAADAIAFATSHELFAGTTTTTFTPGASMTRVMIVTVLARYASDASAAVIGYAEGQQWAVETGISDGSNMSGTVTRQQMAAMLYRYAGSPAAAGDLAGFPDAASVSDYAADAMTWAVENGIITGMADGTLNPYGLATRAQVATILQRFVTAFAE